MSPLTLPIHFPEHVHQPESSLAASAVSIEVSEVPACAMSQQQQFLIICANWTSLSKSMECSNSLQLKQLKVPGAWWGRETHWLSRGWEWMPRSESSESAQTEKVHFPPQCPTPSVLERRLCRSPGIWSLWFPCSSSHPCRSWGCRSRQGAGTSRSTSFWTPTIQAKQKKSGRIRSL